MKLYRVVYRVKGSDGEWLPHVTYSRGQAIYTAAGTAKGVVTRENRYTSRYEFRVEVTETDWQPI